MYKNQLLNLIVTVHRRCGYGGGPAWAVQLISSHLESCENLHGSEKRAQSFLSSRKPTENTTGLRHYQNDCARSTLSRGVRHEVKSTVVAVACDVQRVRRVGIGLLVFGGGVERGVV